jgi:hypothetical protein
MNKQTKINLNESLNRITQVSPELIRSLNGITQLKPDGTTASQNNITNVVPQQSQNPGTQNQSGASSQGK